jgi:hypothetical protein
MLRSEKMSQWVLFSSALPFFCKELPKLNCKLRVCTFICLLGENVILFEDIALDSKKFSSLDHSCVNLSLRCPLPLVRQRFFRRHMSRLESSLMTLTNRALHVAQPACTLISSPPRSSAVGRGPCLWLS